MAKFPQGVSGNLAGRPRGIPDRRAQFRDLIVSRAPDVIQKIIDAALGGDMTAAKVLIDKILPNIRYSDVPIRLTATGDSLGERGDSAIGAMVGGEISPAQAAQVTAALLNMSKIREVDDLIARIERLEAQGRDGAPQ